MANNIDELPYYDPIIKEGTNRLHGIWRTNLSTLIQNLQGYLSQNGIFAPQLTTTQRNAITSPINGQIIYNVTTNKIQGYQNGAWVDLA